MTTRTTSEIFAPAIANANYLMHYTPRIQREKDKAAMARQIECLFRSGRINGSDKIMLTDLYVSEA